MAIEKQTEQLDRGGFLTVSEVCARWPIVSRDRVLRAISRGDMKARREKDRGKWYVSVEDINRWLSSWQDTN